MTSTYDMLKARREEILALAAKYGVTDVRVFGSVARGEEDRDSDIDILVNRIPDMHLGLQTYNFPVELEKMFGRKIDFVYEPNLHWVIREDVLKEAKPI